MLTRPIFVVGLQKSGTSLLQRLLTTSGIAHDPFRGSEGDAFWGNEPPFEPTGDPAGVLYQRHHGDRGHRLTCDDATPEAIALLHDRMAALRDAARPLVNKNPYNAVRIPWLRSVFPDALVVAVTRAPVPNVYSLAKKHVLQETGRPPEHGWWGVKPPGWHELVQPDKVVQSARQWAAVNRILTEDGADLVVGYASLCGDPEMVLRSVEAAAGLAPVPALALPELRCHDGEYRTGSRLRSKNRYFRETGSLTTPAHEPVEFPPFTPEQIEAVESIVRYEESR